MRDLVPIRIGHVSMFHREYFFFFIIILRLHLTFKRHVPFQMLLMKQWMALDSRSMLTWSAREGGGVKLQYQFKNKATHLPANDLDRHFIMRRTACLQAVCFPVMHLPSGPDADTHQHSLLLFLQTRKEVKPVLFPCRININYFAELTADKHTPTTERSSSQPAR